ncbi:hypothetical protein BEN47_05055 [Hymenobacter lapidarius]|uniref:Helix-turn-helix domain-containing protein n=1 Tax=Hymenobacter lapidarius TaxID=1908237 RepID=A0A1G1STN4_9BACT|nr:helix-turn-helix domain-containing protein [Hymenobacter lapidarius]OGX81990.1 hypothetical protein BEN47_05055 [Hymenobacter lapidarius]
MLHNVSFTTANGVLAFEDREAVLRVLAQEQTARLAAEAEQAALATIYTVATLATRLGISVRVVGDLLREGRIRYTCCGLKAYRVTELAVREFLGDAAAPPNTR